MQRATVGTVLWLSLLYAAPTLAQVASGSPPPPPDDAPSIAVGVEIFPDYTYTLNPTTTDTDGNTIHFNQFNLTRGFINVTGRLSRLISFRVTPDVARETSLFSALTGSLELRMQYAYAEFDFDDWMTPGSFARFGIQQTPWLDFIDNIYRYRFQGPTFAEREGFLMLGDAGASFHYELPSQYGDVHVGFYNGEGATRAEVNNRKSLQARGTLRPFAASTGALHGLRASVFYDADAYVENAPRNRFIAAATFENRHINAAAEFLDTADRLSISRPEVDGRGYSIWATPRFPKGVEALLRYDHMKPNTALGSQVRNRTILGVAYWFVQEGRLATALLIDYDGQTFDNVLPAQPKQSRVAVNGLLRF